MTKNAPPPVSTFSTGSKGFAMALATHLVAHNIPFSCEERTFTVDANYADQLEEACSEVAKAINHHMEVVTDTDSEEQSGSYANGTLSRVATGVAVTVQVHPVTPFEQAGPALEKNIPQMFYPLLVQGWEVVIVLGPDLDTPD